MSNIKINNSKTIIKSRLKELGYFPELNTSSKYIAKLRSKMGLNSANHFLRQVDLILENSNDPEFEIAKLIGDNDELLRMVYSTGIESSIYIMDAIFEILDQTQISPNHIIDLGGANGWSLVLLQEYFEESFTMTSVEQNQFWKSVSPEITTVNERYADFHSEQKANLIISIFGSTMDDTVELFECVERNLTDDGVFITGLRIPDNYYFELVSQKASQIGLNVDLDKSGKVFVKSSIGTERFPILVFSRANYPNEDTLDLDRLKSFQ